MAQQPSSAPRYQQQSRGLSAQTQENAEAPSDLRQDSTSEEDMQLYQSDEFRIWCMKVIHCTKRYVHDWSVCPFAHAGEKAVRRDPRTHEYTGIACPDMKKHNSCLRGDSCPYAHNVYEYWLHPTRYRTQLCNDGPSCSRAICFFAHSLEELRTPAVKPYVSPQTLARASLQAIQQNPHPLGQTLGSPLGQGRSGGSGSCRGLPSAPASPFASRTSAGSSRHHIRDHPQQQPFSGARGQVDKARRADSFGDSAVGGGAGAAGQGASGGGGMVAVSRPYAADQHHVSGWYGQQVTQQQQAQSGFDPRAGLYQARGSGQPPQQHLPVGHPGLGHEGAGGRGVRLQYNQQQQALVQQQYEQRWGGAAAGGGRRPKRGADAGRGVPQEALAMHGQSQGQGRLLVPALSPNPSLSWGLTEVPPRGLSLGSPGPPSLPPPYWEGVVGGAPWLPGTPLSADHCSQRMDAMSEGVPGGAAQQAHQAALMKAILSGQLSGGCSMGETPEASNRSLPQRWSGGSSAGVPSPPPVLAFQPDQPPAPTAGEPFSNTGVPTTGGDPCQSPNCSAASPAAQLEVSQGAGGGRGITPPPPPPRTQPSGEVRGGSFPLQQASPAQVMAAMAALAERLPDVDLATLQAALEASEQLEMGSEERAFPRGLALPAAQWGVPSELEGGAQGWQDGGMAGVLDAQPGWGPRVSAGEEDAQHGEQDGQAAVPRQGSMSTASSCETGVTSPGELPPGIPAGSGPMMPAVPAGPAGRAGSAEGSAAQETAASLEEQLPVEGLVQLLAGLKMRRASEQATASTINGSNHGRVISSLNEILQDALAQQEHRGHTTKHGA